MKKKIKQLVSLVTAGSLVMSGFITCSNLNEIKAEENNVKTTKKYEATTESLETYEVPEWYRDAKLGIFIHYGIYSVPAFGDEWYGHWMYMSGTKSYGGSDIFGHHLQTYGGASKFGYKDFIPEFNKEIKKFSSNNMAEQWAELFQKAGAKYVMPVGMHHDSFALYASDVQKTYNSVTQAGVDYIGELQKAVKNHGMKFGISNHFAENDWFFDESYGKGTDMVDPLYSELYGVGGGKTKAHVEKWYAIQSEITEKYKPDLIYFDFDLVNSAFNTYEQANRYQMLADYYNMAAENNLGVVCNFKNGAFTNSEAVLNKEREALGYINPAVWQTDTSIGRKSWGYTTDDVYRPASEIISALVDIVSKNGNLLINVGPMADGTIPEQMVNTLTDLGAWLNLYGDAIYSTRPWLVYGEGTTVNSGDTYTYTSTDIRFTKSKDNKILYATALAAPKSETLVIKTLKEGEWDASKIASVSLINGSERIKCKYTQTENGLEITVPDYANIKTAYSVEITFTDEVIPPVGLVATNTNQPDNAYEMNDLSVEACHADGTSMVVNSKNNGYAKYLLNSNGKDLAKIAVTVSGDSDGTIEVRKGSTDGEILGTVTISKSDTGSYRSITGDVNIAAETGNIDVCLIFNGNIKLSDFKFMEKRGVGNVIEAEDFDEKKGTVQPEPTLDSEGGNENIGYVTPGDWVKYNAVDFGENCNKLLMRLAGTGQSCVVRIDSVDGQIIAKSGPVNTGSWGTYATYKYDISGVTGVHDVYIVFDSACNVNWFEFVAAERENTTNDKTSKTDGESVASPEESEKESKLPVLLIVIAGIVVLGVAVGTAALVVNRKKAKKNKLEKQENTDEK